MVQVFLENHLVHLDHHYHHYLEHHLNLEVQVVLLVLKKME